MNEKDLTSQEQVERLAKRLDGAQCTSGCGTMKFCICAYAADCVDTLRALSAALEGERAENLILRQANEGLSSAAWTATTRADAAEAVHAAALGVIRECILELDELGAVTVPKRARAFLARHQKEAEK